MQQLILNLALTVGLPLVITAGISAAVSYVKSSKSTHAQNMASVGGVFVKEAVLWAEEIGLGKGWAGWKKAEEASSLYVSRMAEAGFKVSVENAQVQVLAVHTAMSLDKTTAYNDKPTSTGDAKAAAGQ